MRYQKALGFGAKFYSIFPKSYRLWVWNQIAPKRGKLRIAQRYMLLKTLAKDVGDNVSIHDNVYIFHPENLICGSNVSIHPMCYLQASGGVTIGDDVSIAHGVTIMTENHSFSDLNIPIKEQAVQMKGITIESNVWIGAKSTILYGNTIHTGAIVGAAAVVTKDVLKNEIVGGVPAKRIKTRE